jgi:TolB protein
VRGVVRSRGDMISVQLYLHDVQKGTVVLGKEYEAHNTQARVIAHRFGNEIMRYFTGEPGVFGSQIAFSSKVGRFKELFVMDMDGSNLRQLTEERGLAISASWHPREAKLIYTSYQTKVPNLFEVDVVSRRTRQITKTNTLEVGAEYGQDGSTVLTSQSRGRDSGIVLLSGQGQLVRRLTSVPGAIDVSPTWSPDYARVAFVSNRAGGPQIYVMNSDGSGVRRISFVASNYCTDPAWSPRGDRVAFVCRADGGFNIFSARPDGSDPLQITSYGNNEDPAWSPDGRYLVFSSTMGRGGAGNLVMTKADGTSPRQITQARIGDSAPTWGPVPGF